LGNLLYPVHPNGIAVGSVDLQIARPRVQKTIVVAWATVGRAHRPATETYMVAGFQAWQRRRLYVEQLRSADQWHASFQQVFHAGPPAGDENFTAAPAPS
jgi:hypothetical protein